MTRVLLVRHGQSEWNADGRWQGQADPPLTDLGRAQALHAARSLGAVDAIVASDLQRAAETAQIIAEALGIGPLVLDADLRERDAGEWSGLTRAEIERDWPGYLGPPPPDRMTSLGEAPAGDGQSRPSVDAADRDTGLDTGPASRAAEEAAAAAEPPRRPPGWEPDEALRARAVAALVRVHATVPDGEVVVVTHGGLVYALEALFDAPFVRLPNLGGRWIEVGPTGPERLGDRVVLIDPDEVTVPNQI